VVLAVLPTHRAFRAAVSPTTVVVMDTITVITGGNKGLGLESARRLKEAGHTVLIGARDAARGRAAADELGVNCLSLDVTDQASVDAAAERVRSEYGRLDVLINNAGITGSFQPLEQTSAEDAGAVLDTNVLGVMRVTNAFVPLLAESEHATPARSSGYRTSAATRRCWPGCPRAGAPAPARPSGPTHRPTARRRPVGTRRATRRPRARRPPPRPGAPPFGDS